MRMSSFLAPDFTAFLSARSKFSSLEEASLTAVPQGRERPPEVTIGTKRVCGGSRAAQTGVAPALELFCSPCLSKHRSSATRCIVTREAGRNGVQTRIFVRTLLSTEIIRPIRTVIPWGVDRRTCSRGRADTRQGCQSGAQTLHSTRTGELTEVAVYVAKRDHRHWRDGRTREKQQEPCFSVKWTEGALR